MTENDVQEMRIRRICVLSIAAMMLVGTEPIAVRADDPEDKAFCKHAAELVDGYTENLHIHSNRILPITRRCLEEHHVQAFFSRNKEHPDLEIVLDGVRQLDIPENATPLVEELSIDKASVLTDARSRLDRPWAVDEVTVIAADVAYEIELEVDAALNARGRLDPQLIADKLPDYAIVKTYADTFSGFTGVALEQTAPPSGQRHRIYAIAGSHVFYHPDLRTWASGLTMARAQFVSGAALRMIRDAADYAQGGADGGEVFITGQSQGGLSSQGVGYLLQVLLDRENRPHHLVHVVSWGAAGAAEALVRMIAHYQDGQERGFWPEFEQHWSVIDPRYPAEFGVWRAVATTWDGIPPPEAHRHVLDTASRMRVVGYFFEIDLFARGGTFIGTPMVFPTALVLPDNCEQLVAERVASTSGGDFGVALESHFLNGYERAVRRGAVGLAWPAQPKKWSWVVDLLPKAEAAGDIWLTNIYLKRLGESAHNWAQCFDAQQWITDKNHRCERPYWPGCSGRGSGDSEAERAAKAANWCLISSKRG